MADKLDLVLERTIEAPVELVWQAYTDPEHLKRWFAPRPYEITECEVDATPGHWPTGRACRGGRDRRAPEKHGLGESNP